MGVVRNFTYQGFNFFCYIEESKQTKCNPIVFINGAFQNIKSWSNYLKYYTHLSSVILVDLPGTGTSDILPYEYSLDFLAESLNYLFNEMEIKQAEIVSASYGTPVGILFANKYPEKASNLILIGAMKNIPDYIKSKIESSFIQFKEKKINEPFYKVLDIIMNKEEKNNIHKYDLIKRSLMLNIKNLSYEDGLKFIENSKRLIHHKKVDYNFNYEKPVLIFTGEYDSFTKPDYCREIALFFKKSIFTTIKNADHLCNIEQFDITNKLITSYILNNDLSSVEGCNKIEKT